ncbi:unnamed protein product, partial [Chrysoparadoxa australica]
REERGRKGRSNPLQPDMPKLRVALPLALVATLCSHAHGFAMAPGGTGAGRPLGAVRHTQTRLCSVGGEPDKADAPQTWASGVSTKGSLVEAIEQAAARCKASVADASSFSEDLALVHISSIYMNAGPLSAVVDHVRAALPGVKAVLGCTSTGVVGMKGGRPVEIENQLGVEITLASLPGVQVHPFHLSEGDVPEVCSVLFATSCPHWSRGGILFIQLSLRLTQAWVKVPAEKWADIGLPPLLHGSASEDIILMYPTPKFITVLSDFLHGLDTAFPMATKFGAIAGSVSSLSRPQLFVSLPPEPGKGASSFSEGVAGVVLSGDIQAKVYVSQGARAVGPVFSCEETEGSTIKSVKMIPDKAGGDSLPPAELSPLAAVKMLQGGLPPNEASLIRKGPLLFGIEPGRLLGAPKDVKASLAISGVATKNAKDGSVTMGGAEVGVGKMMQVFVRDSASALSELDAVLAEYKKDALEASLSASESSPGAKLFQASGLLMYPGFDRGTTLFEEESYESSKAIKAVALPPGGFFGNGFLGPAFRGAATALYGTSTGYAVLSPRSARQAPAGVLAVEGESSAAALLMSWSDFGEDLISDASEDFAVQRRDIKSGRALSSGSVEYSVAEKLMTPTNRLQAMVWQKESETDRWRDRYPLANLVSQVNKYNMLPQNKPRNLMATVEAAAAEGSASAVIPVLKRKAPSTGSFRPGEDYNPAELAKQMEADGAIAVAVHTDEKFFGGELDHLAAVKNAVSVPVISSDLVVYPYQIYQARQHGADAIQLVAPALPEKDMVLFHKIARALGMQVVVVVSSQQQLERALQIPDVQMVCANGRNLARGNVEPGRALAIAEAAEVPKGVALFAAGGVSTREEVRALSGAGASAVLIGTALLKEE